MPEREVVQFVTSNGVPTGETGPKWASHTADTRLHLGFSCYVFDTDGKLLVTQRAKVKKVWPTVWTNTLCGHPAPGESIIDAVTRRLDYELGMQATDFQVVLPTYTYKTPPYNGIIEHEFCPVYIARASSDPKPNPQEVDNFQWLSWDEYAAQAAADQANAWSYWSKDQLKLLKTHPIVLQYIQST